MKSVHPHRIRVLLADDHPAMLDTIAHALTPEFDVVGVVTDGGAALAAADALDPDVVVLDISMPVLSGIDAAEELRHRGSRSAIVVLTIHDDREFLDAALTAGARGYVLKAQMGADLAAAIRQAHAGETFVSPSLGRRTPDQ